jgi:hypothetical protein
MHALSGTLFALVAGAFFYLASPRQQILTVVRRPGVFVVAGALCCIAGTAFWHGCVNWPAALCATIATLGASLSVMPFAGIATRRCAKLGSPATPNASARASRPTGTP